jgi:peptidyl-prolyl cis-trans isomerase D
MVQKQYNESNSIANIEIVGIPYASISDSTIKVTDNEVANYIKENAAAFQIEEASKSINRDSCARRRLHICRTYRWCV